MVMEVRCGGIEVRSCHRKLMSPRVWSRQMADFRSSRVLLAKVTRLCLLLKGPRTVMDPELTTLGFPTKNTMSLSSQEQREPASFSHRSLQVKYFDSRSLPKLGSPRTAGEEVQGVASRENIVSLPGLCSRGLYKSWCARPPNFSPPCLLLTLLLCLRQ